MLAAWAAWMLVAGCRPATTCQITGTVTVDGTPVDRGLLSFERLDTIQHPCDVYVMNGRFDVGSRSRLGPGRYVVRLSMESRDRKPLAPEHDPFVTPGATLPTPLQNNDQPFLADAWHRSSTLEVTLTIGPNRVDIAGPRDGPPVLNRR